MDGHWMALLLTLGGVTLAELGDKTQLLAMAFVAKYKMLKVMIGVLIATILNNMLAVAIGSCITRFGPAQGWIQAVASVSFIIFGLWTLKGDKLEEEGEVRTVHSFRFDQ